MKRNQKIIALIFFGIAFIVLITTILLDIRQASRIDESLLVKPLVVTTDHSLNKKYIAMMTRTAQLYYTYWNTGEEKYLDAAVSPNFFDFTLPKTKLQGIAGIKNSFSLLRGAMPDLHCSIEDLIIVGNTITARLLFRGTSTGTFLGHPATGKAVGFTAIDILRVQDDKIVQEWHEQDDLSLLKQLNIVPLK